MKNSFIILLFLLFFIHSFSQVPGISVIQFDALEKIMTSKSDSVYVLNFWATWCKPCVEELPAFEQVTKDYKGKNVKVILICMDFKSKLKERVIPFVKKNGLLSEVLLLNEPDYNSWIDKVDKKWSGSIPATLIIKGDLGIRNFFEQSFEFPQLKSEIDKVINQ
ncbi:MAG: redoxin domain-containing protein [Opitutaceae bacterium]|nr:redoxin domain-containing protein [Cytophagales bacterium]